MFARALTSRQILSTTSAIGRASRRRVAGFATVSDGPKHLANGAKHSSDEVMHMEHEVSLDDFSPVTEKHGMYPARELINETAYSTPPTTTIRYQCKFLSAHNLAVNLTRASLQCVRISKGCQVSH
jgi:hypothetical protein